MAEVEEEEEGDMVAEGVAEGVDIRAGGDKGVGTDGLQKVGLNLVREV